jgi:cytochrome c oxidase subunit 2
MPGTANTSPVDAFQREIAVTPDEATSAPLQETAHDYVTRRPERESLAAGEIASDAVGAIPMCSVCHGPAGEGKHDLGAPRIGGLAEWYLARQLKYFRHGLRAATDEDAHGTQMRAIVLMLDGERVIEDLAAYLSTLSPPPAPAIMGGDAAHGRELYAVCMACHGADGRGSVGLNTPNLPEQDGEYLVRQLENFRTGLRGSHPSDVFGQQMRPIVTATIMSRSDAVDIAAYIATLRGTPSAEQARAR